jgi:hypothetical protein
LQRNLQLGGVQLFCAYKTINFQQFLCEKFESYV